MEKRTLLAVVLSVIVISVYWTIQSVLFPIQEERAPQQTEQSPVTGAAPITDESPLNFNAPPQREEVITTAEPVAEERVIIETERLIVELTNAGGNITSFRLRNHADRGDFVEMILSGDADPQAFAVAFGGPNARPVTSHFFVRRLSQYSVEFYRDFNVGEDGGVFRLAKRYDFQPDEYMFELTIILDGGHSVQSFNFSGASYTLGFSPQIGPFFERLDGRFDYRHFYTFVNGRERQERVQEHTPLTIHTRPTWAAIVGKYFTLIGVPYVNHYEVTFSARGEPGLAAGARMFITRPPLNGRTEDTYRFYFGPKNQAALAVFNNGNNSFNMRNMEFVRLASTSGFLAPLEIALKWLLGIFYHIVPNYGIAIIFLTILVKIVLFPLTKKSSEATLKMQALAPKMKEIQDRNKGNTQKMNTELAEFYKKEKYNPIAGCLPMILQLPIFIAMYNLFNTHFDLRGAMFIPGWIPDLSIPESVFNFAPAQIPFLGWSDIRILPFIYVGSQLIFGKVTQPPNQQGPNAKMMKMMLYGMPIIFFFILYDMPSGLLIYWIMSNILSLVQQLGLNKYMAKKRELLGINQPAAAPAVTPPPPRKKKRK